MSDPLYLSLWFPDFDEAAMLPATLAVLKEFPFSTTRPGISAVAVHPVSWAEATVLEREFNPGIQLIEAMEIVSDLLHRDYAYVFQSHWDLWRADAAGNWTRTPHSVTFTAHGPAFEDGISEEHGHILVDYGLDSDFLFEEVEFTSEAEDHIRENVAMLIAFTLAVEKNSGIRGRVLWSESEENLAQKLVARLQRTQ
ncbi:MAG: hypothetical protein ACRD3Q_17125 [Terriglobales bacterium]